MGRRRFKGRQSHLFGCWGWQAPTEGPFLSPPGSRRTRGIFIKQERPAVRELKSDALLWPEQKWWFCTAALMGACLMAPSPSSPLWEELARRTVGRQSPGGSSLIVSMTRRTARELGGTPQLSLEAEGRHPVSSKEMGGCYHL